MPRRATVLSFSDFDDRLGGRLHEAVPLLFPFRRRAFRDVGISSDESAKETFFFGADMRLESWSVCVVWDGGSAIERNASFYAFRILVWGMLRFCRDGSW